MISIRCKELAPVIHPHSSEVAEARRAANPVRPARCPAEAAQSGYDSAGRHFPNHEIVLVGDIEIIVRTESYAGFLVEPGAAGGAVGAAARAGAPCHGGYDV